MSTHGPVLAVLTVIGGLDSRPRLGGMVQHEELGVGTIANVESKGKMTVFFHEQKKAMSCVLSSVKPVSAVQLVHVQYTAVFHSNTVCYTVLHIVTSLTQYSVLQYTNMQYSVKRHYTVQCYTVFYSIALHNTMLQSVVLHSTCYRV